MAVALVAALSAAALIASCFLTVVYVTTSSASCEDLAVPQLVGECSKSGADQHSIAFIAMGLAVLALAILALSVRAPGPYVLIVVVGLAALAVTLSSDLPQSTMTGRIGLQFTDARAHKGTGFWLELGGGALAVAAGVAGFALRERMLD